MTKVNCIFIKVFFFFFQFYGVQKADLEILRWKHSGIFSQSIGSPNTYLLDLLCNLEDEFNSPVFSGVTTIQHGTPTYRSSWWRLCRAQISGSAPTLKSLVVLGFLEHQFLHLWIGNNNICKDITYENMGFLWLHQLFLCSTPQSCHYKPTPKLERDNKSPQRAKPLIQTLASQWRLCQCEEHRAAVVDSFWVGTWET